MSKSYTSTKKTYTRTQANKIIRACNKAKVGSMNLHQSREVYEAHFGTGTFPGDLPYADVPWEVIGDSNVENYIKIATKILTDK